MAAWLSEAERVQLLEPPVGRVRVVLDTDAANEIDDQFAITYALLSQERLDVEAIYAAPFQQPWPPATDSGPASSGVSPADGMVRSYAEIRRVLEALGAAEPGGGVRLGAEAWLPDAGTPVPSPAAEDLIDRAREGAPDGDLLYVVALGAPTNVASALLAAPAIAGRVVIVWLGGNGTWWTPAGEYNAVQDRHASRVLFDSGVPLVHVPCRQVTEKLVTTHEEVEQMVRGFGVVGDYLADLYRGYDHGSRRMKELWDLGAVAWLVAPQSCPSTLTTSPVFHDEVTWGHDASRHLIREVRDIDADAVFADFFSKLAVAAASRRTMS